MVKRVEHISTITVSQQLSGAGSSPAGSVGRDLNLQKFEFEFEFAKIQLSMLNH